MAIIASIILPPPGSQDTRSSSDLSRPTDRLIPRPSQQVQAKSGAFLGPNIVGVGAQFFGPIPQPIALF